ncbi:hypothetical protein TUZN_1950 [Thermoproteus uzoniensis 768-20]|uniref:Uncharacterized protein n=1 Tax=Thermoproteus uzoniensis (strain 768-20) TaxID=999630 RepID=F2L4H7_THEU7|nr:hypothetical protein [Thermoproteus uzoniensis]AEA13409.1 hypothetical protein TUZN_1950 [Thermoproteus uzoniensis 768-20]
MSVVDRKKLLSEIALYILEELALRGGKARAKYLRSYRALEFWAGEDVARDVVKRLAEGGYIKLEQGDVIVLTKEISTKRTIKEIERLSLSIAKSLYKI